MAHILVVDDEAHLRTIFEQYLVYDGHQVQTAVDGVTAMKLLINGNFDLIITDIIMPDQDGLWLVNELSSRGQPPKIIIMTGGSQRLDQQYLLNLAKLLPVQKVLSKPVSREQLKSAVTEVLTLPEKS
jgi:CheY-like chemotaxis protein